MQKNHGPGNENPASGTGQRPADGPFPGQAKYTSLSAKGGSAASTRLRLLTRYHKIVSVKLDTRLTHRRRPSLVKKFTLTVNDHEYELISKWKSDFNLSSIFRDAVLEKISAKERIEKEMIDEVALGDFIKRLKKEKDESDQYFIAIATKDAANWMSSAKYRELVYLESWKIPFDGAEIKTKSLISDPKLGGYFKQMLEHNDAMAPSLKSKYLNNYAKSWLNTWTQAVAQSWNSIKDKI